VVAGVGFFAHPADEACLLDHLGRTADLRFFPVGPTRLKDPEWLDPQSLGGTRKIGILNTDLGDLAVVRPGDRAFEGRFKSASFLDINWDLLKPESGYGLVNWNRTPALFWDRGLSQENVVTVSGIGSQAESMDRVSDDYQRWVNRAMGWVRRRGVKVWGLDRTAPSGYDVDLGSVSAVYALPAAAKSLRSGMKGRSRLPDA